MHAVDLTPVRLHAVRENGDRGGGGGLIGDDELDGIEDDLASNEEWEERASYSIRALETPQCNRRKQEGAGTELRVQDGGENANEGDYDCQEGHHGRCGANRRAPRARSRKFAPSLLRTFHPGIGNAAPGSHRPGTCSYFTAALSNPFQFGFLFAACDTRKPDVASDPPLFAL